MSHAARRASSGVEDSVELRSSGASSPRRVRHSPHDARHYAAYFSTSARSVGTSPPRRIDYMISAHAFPEEQERCRFFIRVASGQAAAEKPAFRQGGDMSLFTRSRFRRRHDAEVACRRQALARYATPSPSACEASAADGDGARHSQRTAVKMRAFGKISPKPRHFSYKSTTHQIGYYRRARSSSYDQLILYGQFQDARARIG